ncbi:gene transfer agent family protein [Methylobacterium aquaticum]|uniref:Uncharacterized protein n=1 Tax=Methylobacterium aquaticum TaxID=270351 RepID=A0A0J6T0L5_9HYPH|nr:gene transfer agent family protein [Methylobacterium aquaticum]KMO40990.1 hypothetical protein VP06_01615 [Methylobacterium aquaticum]
MSQTDTSRTMVRKFFAGRERNFQLRLGEIHELERNCSAGIGEVMARLATHRFGVNDIWEPVRLGLIGGGASALEADLTVQTYHPPHYPIAEFLSLAVEIVQGAVNGVPPGKDETEGASAQAPGTSPSSSAPERSRGSRRKR